MKYIDFDSFTPSASWLAKANAATAQLMALATLAEKKDFIERHSRIWRDLRKELTKHFGHFCWFTEAEELAAHLDIEHFRPKLKALDEDGVEHEGYWWLAFDLSNLRLVGQISNRQYKLCYFPLLDGCVRANSITRRCQDERPIFLDPCNLSDVTLIAFNETGQICPSVSAVSSIDKRRVEVTDHLLGLSRHQPLTERRQQVWRECHYLLEEIKKLKSEESLRPQGSEIINIRMKQLWKMTRPKTAFSSVAVSCISMSGEEWAAKLIAA